MLGVTPTEHRVRLGGDDIEVRVQELGDGPPAVFLHGGPGATGTVWAQLAALLPDVRCLLVDRPGTGLSDSLDLDARTLRPHSERFVTDALDALGIERAHLIGSSHGSYIALATSLASPARVDRTVHMGCPGLVEGMRELPVDRMLLLPGVARLMSRMPASEKELGRSMRRLGHGASLDAGLVPDELSAWALAVMQHTNTMAEDLRLIARLGSVRGFHRHLYISMQELAGVASPTLLYYGDHDPYGDVDHARRLVETLPHARLQVRENAGHLPWIDAPAAAAEAVRTHLLGS